MVIPIDRFEHTRAYLSRNGRFDLQRIKRARLVGREPVG